MRIERTDPVTGNTLTQTDGRPYLIEGEGPDALKIYFESEERPGAHTKPWGPSTRNKTLAARSTIPRRFRATNPMASLNSAVDARQVFAF